MLVDYRATKVASCDEINSNTRFCTAYYSCEPISSKLNEYLKSGTPFSQNYLRIVSELEEAERSLLTLSKNQRNSHFDDLIQGMQSSGSNTVVLEMDQFFCSTLLMRKDSLDLWASITSELIALKQRMELKLEDWIIQYQRSWEPAFVT